MTASTASDRPGFLGLMRRHALLPLIAGLVLAILAPFGTQDFSFLIRLLFWVGCTFAGGFGAIAARLVLRRFAPNAAMLWSALAMSLGATLAVSPFVLSIFSTLSIGSVALSLFYIWVISITISMVGILSDRAREGNQVGLSEPSSIRPPLLDRLPPQFREATLFALKSEDHYVRVFTDKGSHLLLMRLSDAEDLAQPTPGAKPHRSWWVTEAGVTSITRQDGKPLIRLKSGEDVPISRSGAKTLREKNWL